MLQLLLEDGRTLIVRDNASVTSWFKWATGKSSLMGAEFIGIDVTEPEGEVDAVAVAANIWIPFESIQAMAIVE